MKVAILGAGAYGRALGKIVRENGHATKFYDPWKFPERRLDETLEWSEVIILVTPADTVKKLLKQFPAEERKKALVVATKGLMEPEVTFAKHEIVELVSGPGFASEILRDKKVKLTVACEGAMNKGTYAEKLLAGKQVMMDKTEDVKGVALLSGLKNIYAIEAGRRGVEFKTEEFEEYIKDVIREAEKFLLYNGGFLETVRLSAGVGDFVLTCGSEMSRNYRFGQKMTEVGAKWGRKRELREFLKEYTVEGVHAARDIERLGLAVPREAEILRDSIRRIQDAIKY